MDRIALVALSALLAGCGGRSPSLEAARDRSPEAGATAARDAPPPGQAPAPPRGAPERGGGPSGRDAGGDACDSAPPGELSIDGLIDDWKGRRVVARAGSPPDGAVALRCAWDGATLALAFEVEDERIVRVKGGVEDRLSLALSAGAAPVTIVVFPGNPMAKARITRPAGVDAADSLQPRGFSVEVAIPAGSIAGYSPSLPAFQLEAVFHDSDAATGGDTSSISIARPLALGDRADLLADLLAAVSLRRADLTLDTLAELDLDRPGQERLVAGGSVIGVLTEQYAYVTLPAAFSQVELLPLGPRGQQVIGARVRQDGNGGARELLMLWTVWSGQLQPLASIEVKKQLGGNVLESTYAVVRGKRGPTLVIEPKPAIGFTAETWNEVPAGDADSIVLPWDATTGGMSYTLVGAELRRSPLPRRRR